MSQRFYPRNIQSRRDAVAFGDFNHPRVPQSRLDGLFIDPKDPFDNAGGLGWTSTSIDEISVSSSGFSFTFTITDNDEAWNTVLGSSHDISSVFLAGISSVGIALTYAGITRTSDKVLTVAAPATASLHVTDDLALAFTIPRSAFLRRESDFATGTFATIRPVATVISSPGSAITEAQVVTGGQALNFYVVGSDSWNSTFLGTSLGIGAFIAGISSLGFTLTTAVFSLVAAQRATITLPAHAGFTIAADANIAWTVPRSAFTARKAPWTVNTVCVITNGV